jgi:hypothetical protein
MEQRWPVTCSDCGASRDGLADDVVCPGCGSIAKTVHVLLEDAGVAVDGSLGITALLDKQRRWQEKWREIEAAYQAVTDAYNGTRPGRDVEDWKTIALSFFRACHELPEDIDSDAHVPSATRRKARRFVDRRAVLRLVGDVDNTRKHGGRDPNKCHGRVGEISWANDAPPTMTILRECPNRPVERFDVEVSANSALDAWWSFFARNGLVPQEGRPVAAACSHRHRMTGPPPSEVPAPALAVTPS